MLVFGDAINSFGPRILKAFSGASWTRVLRLFSWFLAASNAQP
jgi:hypothetical protein